MPKKKFVLLFFIFLDLLFQFCMKWFLDEKQKAKRSWERDPIQILLFHCTGGRDLATFLPELSVSLIKRSPNSFVLGFRNIFITEM